MGRLPAMGVGPHGPFEETEAQRELVTVWRSHWEEEQREVWRSGYLVQPKSKANISAVPLLLVSFAVMVSKTIDLAVWSILSSSL